MQTLQKYWTLCLSHQPLYASYFPDSLRCCFGANAQQCPIYVAAQPTTMLIESFPGLLQRPVLYGRGQADEELCCPSQDPPAFIAGRCFLRLWKIEAELLPAKTILQGWHCSSAIISSEGCVSLSPSFRTEKMIARPVLSAHGSFSVRVIKPGPAMSLSLGSPPTLSSQLSTLG
jgi:hypothetical protein